ncbi:MFS transporter [Acholeplasma vituli]|uniref:MFS transporter n=1 Tax=Paracholeplasma vituli TaxID=69473 RepID=A0ABT2PXA2_9MOLU|nr:MFS transporter [Paracholeplasma vituli]MCU0104357.1 MFS transporter [Paracholeplasma vituli]
MQPTERTLPKKVWFVFIIFGLIGQMAWTIENMYLNVYIYKTVTYDSNAIATMVALSAIIATLASLTMGALSDKMGKRKRLMTFGYMIWGISIGLFGFINTDAVSAIFPNGNVIVITLWAVILLDCVMTFIGSTANDAAFQAWVTDVTNPSNRGKAEGLISTMPLIGMLIVFGLLDGFTQNEQWKTFFFLVGGIVFISGLVGLFLIEDAPIVKKESHYFKDIVFGFKPSTIRSNRMLYIVYAAVSILGIAQQVFIPYFIIYFEFYLGMSNYVILLGAFLILSSVVSIIGGRYVDRYGKKPFLVISAFGYTVGMFILFILGITLKNNLTWTFMLTLLFGVWMMGSYLVAMVILNALSRDLVPKTHVGVFSGIKMIFFVMIPMIIGPFIGSFVISNSDSTYVDAFGVLQSVPTPGIFLAGSIVSLLAIIPLKWVLQYLNKVEVKL